MSSKSVAFYRSLLCKAFIDYTQELIECGAIEELYALGIKEESLPSIAEMNSKNIQKYVNDKYITEQLFSVSADDQQIRLFAETISAKEENDRLNDDLIRLGAPPTMLAKLAGMSDAMYRRRKEKIKHLNPKLSAVFAKRGAPQRSCADVRTQIMALRDKKSELSIADFINIANSTGVTMKEVWATSEDYEKLGTKPKKLVRTITQPVEASRVGSE